MLTDIYASNKFLVTDIETNGLLDDLTKFWCSWC